MSYCNGTREHWVFNVGHGDGGRWSIKKIGRISTGKSQSMRFVEVDHQLLFSVRVQKRAEQGKARQVPCTLATSCPTIM